MRVFFGILLSGYIASQIIFPLSSNIYISNSINIFLVFSYIIYSVIYKKKKIHLNPLILIYGTFVIFSLSSLIWSISFNWSISSVVTLFIILITLIVIYNLSIEFNLKEYILYGILIGAYFNFFIALGIIDYQTEFTNPYRFVGSFARSTALAHMAILNMFATMILLEIHNHRVTAKAFLFVSLVLTFYIAFLSVSKKGIILSVLLLSTYFLTNIKNIKTVLFVTLLGGLSIYLYTQYASDEFLNSFNRMITRFSEFDTALESDNKFNSTGERLYFIQVGIDLFDKNPFLGSGLDTFRLQNIFHTYSHNNYIELVTNLGIIGAIIYYLIYIYLFKRAYTNLSGKIKYLTIVFLFGLLIMDMALVSYKSKLGIYVLLYVSLMLEQKVSHAKSVQ